MHRGGQAPRPANDIKHGKMTVLGLAGGFWPISNTPLITAVFWLALAAGHRRPRRPAIDRPDTKRDRVAWWAEARAREIIHLSPTSSCFVCRVISTRTATYSPS
jgi:hypothetical protein